MTLPLINLPRNVIRLVTQMMTSNELYNLWSLSKKTKKTVKPLYPRHTHVQRILNNELVLFKMSSKEAYFKRNLNRRTETLTFTYPPAMMISRFPLFNLPDKVIRHVIKSMNYDEIELANYWISKGLSIKKWLDHTKTVFHFSKIDIRFGEDSTTFDINEIRDTFNNCYEIWISDDSSSEAHVMSILKNFSTEILSLSNDLFESGKPPNEVLIQNYDELAIEPSLPSTITLDDLLMMNSRYIEVSELVITEKDVNRFIKHWTKGSNPRMERICISFKDYRPTDKDLVLRDLSYVKFPADQKRYFKHNKCWYRVETVYGGVDIWRRDGTLATITFGEVSDVFSMFVWHPHCVTDRN
ncbi:hypothetical protein GCK72_008276 [Caenorhabditis remanei]|uniref:F-box domain-containing protein n=1 Tax=Caenorhabditis remanei TaxID=31234 RepID=A0A6A5GX30_CAERE|nr:hypothetical protein GCK72_008276 [Caenorhabditis remanei]KAF1760030.1 hypothetical protein GCK72_008276 [Caenorhabditis remanei]